MTEVEIALEAVTKSCDAMIASARQAQMAITNLQSLRKTGKLAIVALEDVLETP